MLPLEELRKKYIPIVDFPAKYGISVFKVMSLIDSKKIRKAEFRAPGDTRRSLHANYEEVLEAVRKEGIKDNESNT